MSGSLAKNIALGAVALLLLGAAVTLGVRALRQGDAKAADFPDGIRMICADSSCGKAFTTTLSDIAEARAEDGDAALPCPHCAAPSVRATRCASCDGSFPLQSAAGARGSTACPLCGAALPRLTAP